MYAGTESPVVACATASDNSDAIKRGDAIINGGQFK